jgi:hypothetical protein
MPANRAHFPVSLANTLANSINYSTFHPKNPGQGQKPRTAGDALIWRLNE